MQQETSSSSLSPFPYIGKIQGDKPEPAIYVVYSASGTSHRVPATTASEAIKKSGLKDAIRVLRHDPLRQVLLSGDDFSFEDSELVSEEGEAVAAEQTGEAAPAEEAPAEAADNTESPQGEATPPADAEPA